MLELGALGLLILGMIGSIFLLRKGGGDAAA